MIRIKQLSLLSLLWAISLGTLASEPLPLRPQQTHEKTPGRSQVFSSPSGGLAQSDRSGGSHEKTPGRSQVFSSPSGGLAQSDRSGGALWELGLGAGILRLPHYPGADQHHSWLLPVPYVIYRGSIFKADREGTRAQLFESRRLDVDVSAALSAPTRSQNNRARAGMADLAPTFELGPNLNWHLVKTPTWQLDLRLPLRAVATLQKNPRALGWSFTPKLNVDVADLGGWKLGLQVGPQFGTRRLHGYFYDVTSEDARPGRPAYPAPGGFAGLQLTAAVSRMFNNNSTWVGLFVRGDHLQNARFAASPLVKQTNQASIGIAVAWVLARSSEVVSPPSSTQASLEPVHDLGARSIAPDSVQMQGANRSHRLGYSEDLQRRRWSESGDQRAATEIVNRPLGSQE